MHLPRVSCSPLFCTAHRMDEAAALPLLQLPEPCLLAVLRYCADEPRSLFSAARAHSRLRQAAAVAMDSISTAVTCNQQLGSVMKYLHKHTAHVKELQLEAMPDARLQLQHIPAGLQLETLDVKGMQLQLAPGRSSRGVLQADMPLTQLRLAGCMLLDGAAGLPAALPLLTSLQHLLVTDPCTSSGHGQRHNRAPPFPAQVLQQLQQLTALELSGVKVDRNALQALALLTCLRKLRLLPANSISITTPLLAGMRHLTALQLGTTNLSVAELEPAALAGLTQLQHLDLAHCELHEASPGEAAGQQALLSQLQQLTQLTHLRLYDVLMQCVEVPAAAFSALTASSRLQHFDVAADSQESIWECILPAGRQLPHLKWLSGDFVDADANPQPEDIARVAACCPAVQELHTHGAFAAELLSPLTCLRGLSKLMVELADVQGVQVLAQLTGLRVLRLFTCTPYLDLSPLTRLQQVTYLDFVPINGDPEDFQYAVSVIRTLNDVMCPGSAAVLKVGWLLNIVVAIATASSLRKGFTDSNSGKLGLS